LNYTLVDIEQMAAQRASFVVRLVLIMSER